MRIIGDTVFSGVCWSCLVEEYFSSVERLRVHWLFSWPAMVFSSRVWA